MATDIQLDQPKLCRDCKWSVGGEYLYCDKTAAIDPLTGGVERQGCRESRRKPTAGGIPCGPEGALWEARQ